jgi:two-component system, NarL family, response regulator DesR
MSMNLMIIDDHDGMRKTIRHLICTPGDQVVECASADEALTRLGDFKPDCVTMDISMAGTCAFQAMRTIREAHPPVRMICVTSHDQPDYRRAALEAGASGFVLKDNLADLYLLVATKRLLSRLQL